MRVLLTTRALAQPGGSETYLVTVARELRALGHELTIYSPELGSIAQRMRAEGFEVLDSLDGCPLPDVAHVQHATTAFRVRGRFPELPMVFVSHSSIYDIENVPALASPQAVVVLSDVVGRRVRAGAWADTGTVVAHAYTGVAEPNLSADPRLVRRTGFDVKLAGSSETLAGYVKWNDYGPYDYYHDFNLTYPVQVMGEFTHTLGTPIWFTTTPQTMLGLRAIWRSLDEYSPRFSGNLGDPRGSEWEVRTYVKLAM